MARPVDVVFGELVAWASMLTPQQLGLLLASSLLSGAGATWFQSNGQRKASAPKAQLWFAMTPVFGAFWALTLTLTRTRTPTPTPTLAPTLTKPKPSR